MGREYASWRNARGASSPWRKVRTVRGRLSGSISTADLQVDEDGRIRHVEEPRRDPTAIFDVVQQGATVTFSRKVSAKFSIGAV
jgi:hypothetical protein